jgi:hypothetical protein
MIWLGNVENDDIIVCVKCGDQWFNDALQIAFGMVKHQDYSLHA